eukprot:gb/GECH01004189.1/.p1 GENE.gb/GECH01004189.1/~~gb/GECH01004189.1/.p1  ORF type:complete len:244 (+),score=64.36 gb/GECH01004189.1/:1-732(+)
MRSFAMGKQYFLQKVGKAEKSEEPEEYQELCQDFDKTCQHLTKAIKHTKGFCAQSSSVATTTNEMGEMFSDFGIEDGSDFGSTMTRIGETIKSAAAVRHAMNTNMAERYVQAAMKFKEDTKKAKEARIRYNKIKLEYDAQKNKVNNLRNKSNVDAGKLQLAETGLTSLENQKQEAYQAAEDAMTNIMVKRDTEYLLQLCELIKALHFYFQEGYSVTSELKPHIDEISDSIQAYQQEQEQEGGE